MFIFRGIFFFRDLISKTPLALLALATGQSVKLDAVLINSQAFAGGFETSYQLPVTWVPRNITRGKCTRWAVTTSSELELIRESLTPRSSKGTVSPNLYYLRKLLERARISCEFR